MTKLVILAVSYVQGIPLFPIFSSKEPKKELLKVLLLKKNENKIDREENTKLFILDPTKTRFSSSLI